MGQTFSENETIIHPKHGLGRISTVGHHEMHGESARYLTVAFDRSMLTLRIPEEKIAQSGMRPVSSSNTMRSALDVLQEPAMAFSGHWTKRQDQLLIKLNSGDPQLLAELVRDLSSGKSLAGGRVCREALLRLAEELAIIDGIEPEAARASIAARLPADPSRSKLALAETDR